MSKEINDYRKVLDILSDKDITGIYSISHQGGEYIVDFLDETTRLDTSLHLAETELNKRSNRTCKKTHKFNVGDSVILNATGRVYTILVNTEFHEYHKHVPIYTIIDRRNDGSCVILVKTESGLRSADIAHVDNKPKPKFNVGDEVILSATGRLYTVRGIQWLNGYRNAPIYTIVDERNDGSTVVLYKRAFELTSTTPLSNSKPQPKFNVGDIVESTPSGMVYTVTKVLEPRDTAINAVPEEYGYAVSYKGTYPIRERESKLKYLGR